MSAGNMQLTAVVGVCDEVEIIGPCLDHLESQGVDSIVVIDMLSRDGTRELLRRWRDAGRLTLLERDNDSEKDAAYLQAGVECARRTWDPTWILIQDADEFCLAAGASLRQAMARREPGVLEIPRYNACLSQKLLAAFAAPPPLSVGALELWVAPRKLSREAMDQDATVRWSAAQPAPKVIAAAACIASVAAGGHAVVDTLGNAIPAAAAPDLLIVHVPFLSFARFERKIRRASDLFGTDRTYFTGATGWHWRRWAEILHAGKLEDEYRRQILDGEELASAVESGEVRSAEVILAARAGSEMAAT